MIPTKTLTLLDPMGNFLNINKIQENLVLKSRGKWDLKSITDYTSWLKSIKYNKSFKVIIFLLYIANPFHVTLFTGKPEFNH